MREFGLPHTTTHTIRQILAGVPAVETAIIYGSRAKGTHRPGSDIDLTLFDQIDHAGLREPEEVFAHQRAAANQMR
jgi:predicted nucleotidyltransferase